MKSKTIQKNLRDHLIDLGIKKKDNLLIHSDLSRFGLYNHSIIKIFINELIKSVGPKGSLAMPLYNYKLKNKSEVNFGTYDKSLNSILALEFYKKYSVIKTNSILHSHIIFGNYKKKFVNNSFGSYGRNSDFNEFKKNNFKILLMGCDLTAATYLKNIEYNLNLNHREKKLFTFFIKKNGKKFTKTFIYKVRKKKIQYTEKKIFREKEIVKIIRSSNLNFGKSYIFSIKQFDKVVKSIIKKKPNIFLNGSIR